MTQSVVLSIEAARATGSGGDLPLRAVVEKVPAAIYTTDAKGRITFFNEAAAALWGCSPEIGTSEFCGSWKLFWPDGTPLPHDQCPMALALKERRAITGMEAVAERPDGTRIPFMQYPSPIFDTSGNLIGAVNMLVDLSHYKRSEDAAARLAAIVESSDDAIVSKDLNGIIVSWNRAAERLLGYLAEEIIGKPVATLIPADRHEEEPTILDRIRRGERIDHYETVRRCKDGRLIDVSLTVSPVRDSTGRVTGASKILRDITDKKQAERVNVLLGRELEHRVKNILSTVQSLTRLTEAETKDEFIRILSGRFQALAQAQSLLASSRWKGATLTDLVSEELAAYGIDEGGRVSITGPRLKLGPQAAQVVAMVVHELATNAAKYGALSTPNGRLSIELVPQPKTFTLRWRESGGPPVKKPAKIGFGSKLIKGTLQQLGAEIRHDWSQGGLSCEMVFPVDALLS